jgi:hypothetical protein
MHHPKHEYIPRYWQSINRSVCSRVSNPISVGRDVILLLHSERYRSDVSREICEGIVLSRFVHLNSNFLSEESSKTTEVNASSFICVLSSER